MFQAYSGVISNYLFYMSLLTFLSLSLSLFRQTRIFEILALVDNL